MCVPLTGNLHWSNAPGNVTLSARETGLPQESVANVSQVVTLDKSVFSKQIGRIPARSLELVFAGIDVVLGR